MSPHANIQWIGIRKDSGKGSVWGYFIQAGKPDRVITRVRWFPNDLPDPICHEFFGKIGKKLTIIERIYDTDFLLEVRAKQKNYKEANPEKITARWGKNLQDDFDMYLTMLLLKG